VTTQETVWTITELIKWSKGYLADKGFENARLETELLLGHTLSLPRIELYVQHDRQLSEDELARYKALFKRRLAWEPVQYVTGTAAFMMAEFEVTPAVLIPRPETEAMTEVAIGLMGGAAGHDSTESGSEDLLLLADIGTGSGVIAITLARRFPGAEVVATDISAAALLVAARNAERIGVSERVRFAEGAGVEPLAAMGLAGKLSGIVSNPPYIRSGDMKTLPQEVREFEPGIALDGGGDGLDCIRSLAQDGPELLADGGLMVIEFGDGQGDAVRELMETKLAHVEIHKDYAGRDRIATGIKTTEANIR
jgi:release factor glutamine methyltransferase